MYRQQHMNDTDMRKNNSLKNQNQPFVSVEFNKIE